MTPFLKQVACHYYGEGDMSRICFILPNKRSASFFRKYIGECVESAGRALMGPEMVTMNDFFYGLSSATQTDQVNLLLELYGVYN